MIQEERIRRMNRKAARAGDFVLYWMQASQRAECNYALEYAVGRANEAKKPLVVYFGITDQYLGANRRHYAFMLEGLEETRQALFGRGIRMVIRHEEPVAGVVGLARQACLVVMDGGYLSIQRRWRRAAARRMACEGVQVESDVIVPVEAVSQKEEYAAATLRPKMHRMLEEYLKPLKKVRLKYKSTEMVFKSFDIGDLDRALSRLKIDDRVGTAPNFRGGTKQAKKRLRDFMRNKLVDYDTRKNDPTIDGSSNLSPYLHFGQISPLYVALEVLKSEEGAGRDSFLEELIVRRELSINFVYYNSRYDKFGSLPAWTQATLNFHRRDRREYIYTPEEFEEGRTHDPYWNAAQQEMVLTGKMHGYMRMYWGKKILEWSRSAQRAMATAQYLNDKYELDGRDPNGYTGVAWCFGKHDRPWGERPIFGKVRYMNAAGLRRKFEADGYVAGIERLGRELGKEVRL